MAGIWVSISPASRKKDALSGVGVRDQKVVISAEHALWKLMMTATVQPIIEYKASLQPT